MNKACLLNTLKHDAEFLSRIGIIDYSLLVRKQKSRLNRMPKIEGSTVGLSQQRIVVPANRTCGSVYSEHPSFIELGL